jgi:hypothetical protein
MNGWVWIMSIKLSLLGSMCVQAPDIFLQAVGGTDVEVLMGLWRGDGLGRADGERCLVE